MRKTKDKKIVISWVLILSIITANLNVPLMAAEQTQTYIADSGNNIQTSNITDEENVGLGNQVSDNQASENEIPDSQVSDNQTSDNQVSENEISGNEVSGNIVSENALSGNEIGIFDLSKAKQALSEIINQKDIMALVYLTDSIDVRKGPTSDSSSVKKVKSGQLVFIQDVAIGLDDESIWYYVKIADTDTYGYLPRYYLACSDELLLKWEKEYLGGLSTYENAVGGDTSAEIEAFPGSYQNKLYQLKALHPGWTFVPYQPGIDWNTAIDKQYGNYSWIYDTAPSEYKEGSADTHWNYASKKGIAYYMDPRNFLNESNLFQFEQLTYNKDYHTEAAVKSLLSGSFMSGEIARDDGDSTVRTYANVFCSLGASDTIQVSPFHLAARVFLEQGTKGSSALISGKYPDYENLYNYFNIGASGSGEAVIISGLTKARSSGWNTRYKSLAGGAKFIGSGYIKIGQDTIYLEKFDMPSLKDGSTLHQYMQNIQAPYSEGNKIKGAYQSAGKLNSVFVFKIPVYENMPNAVSLSATSKTMNKGTTYQLTGSLNGSKVDASNFTWSSSDSSIASVDATGLVTAEAVSANGVKGTATIKAVDKNDSENVATCKVTTVSPLTSIQLSLSQNAVERFQAFDLQVNYLPEDTTDNRTVTWSTKNSGIAWIQNKTNINGISDKCSVSTNTLGTTSITAKVGAKTAACEVTVRSVIKNIDFEEESITIYEGQAQKLQVNYEPIYTSDEVQFEWNSKNEDIARVDNGVLTGVGEGSTIITAKFVNGIGEIKQANCTVSVNTCKVKYYDANDNLFKSVDKEYGSAYGPLEIIAAPNNTEFAGWYTKKDGQGTKVSEEELVLGTVSLYPYFLELDKGFTVKPIGNQMYTGSAIVPAVNVYDKNTLLKLNQDYTVAYKNNKNVNNAGSTSDPYVIVKGKGNYEGSQTVSFNIIPKNINRADFSVDDIFVAYNGKVIKSVPVVMQGSTKLKQNTHYKVSYPSLSKEYAYQQPGVYPVLVEGIRNYTGSRLIYEVITKKVLASKLTVAKIPNQTYTGNEKQPKLIVKYGKTLLTEGTHYTIDYGNDNIGIGKKTLTIHGISSAGYLGSKIIAYNIVGRDIRKVEVSGIEAKEFTNDYKAGGIVQDKYSLIFSDSVKLTEGVDYEVSYLKNKQVGTATIIFTGKNGYSGILKKTFKITKHALNESMVITMDHGSKPFTITYLKDASKPELIISSNGITLTKNVDYTLSYQNYSVVNDGSDPLKQPTVIIKGKGNYSGSLSCNYKITQADFKNTVVTALDATYSAKAGKWKSSPVVKDTNGKTLKAGSDYEKTISYNYVDDTVLEDEGKTVRLAGSTVEMTDIPPAGAKIQVRVTGKGNYSADSITCIYRITQTSIAKASVNVKSQVYNKDKAASTEGITVSQNDIIIKLSKVELQNEDYVIIPNSFTNNKTKGTASFTIQGIGNYGGTKKVTFKITSFPIIWWWKS